MRVTIAWRDGTTEKLTKCTGVAEHYAANGTVAEYQVTQGDPPERIVTRYPAQAVLFVRSSDQEGDDA